MTEKKKYSAPALEKGLDILELLSIEDDGLKVTDITQKLDKSVGELFRMLMVLEQRGYVEVVPGTDRYRLSLELFRLGNRLPRVKRLTSVAGPVLKSLAFKLEQSCHLVTFYDGEGHIIAQQDSPSACNFSVRLGSSMPLMNTCSGHILLSFASKERFELMVKQIPKHHPKLDMKDFDGVLKRITNARYETMESKTVHGVKDIGFPVFDDCGDILAALVVPFMNYIDDSHPVTFEEAKESISIAAAEISKLLGFSAD